MTQQERIDGEMPTLRLGSDRTLTPAHRARLSKHSCQACGRTFNERTGTPFNHLQYPTDVVRLAVLWRLRYKLSFRDVAELLLDRGFQVTHETRLDCPSRSLPVPRIGVE